MIRFALFPIVFFVTTSTQAQPAIVPPAQPEWTAGALAFMPEGYVAGQAFGAHSTGPADGRTLTGYIAAYPKGANDPQTPASTFDIGSMLVVKLERIEGKLKAVSGDLRARDAKLMADVVKPADAAQDDSDDDALNATLLTKGKSLPPGTMPCDLHGWSIDRDPKGLNVRAAPGTGAKILGTLPPPYTFRAKGNNVPERGWLTEFSIIGFREGWFLIENATPPGKDYEDETIYPRNHPRPYAGRGWVAASKVGANFANGGTRMGGLFQAPHTDAQWLPAKTGLGAEIGPDGGPKRIFACSGFWALVESHDNVRGWWRRLCSNQVTNCS